MTDQSSEPREDQPANARQPLSLRRFADAIEDILQRARDDGHFDNLETHGKPLPRKDNFYAGEKALAYDILENNGALPPELERGNEIDDELRHADELITTLRNRLAAINQASASDCRAWNILRDKTASRVREHLQVAHSKTLSYNIMMPPTVHRPSVKVEARMAAFEVEFPRLAE